MTNTQELYDQINKLKDRCVELEDAIETAIEVLEGSNYYDYKEVLLTTDALKAVL